MHRTIWISRSTVPTIFRIPAAPILHGMLIPVYHQITDYMDGQIAFSRDGLFWSRPERKPIIEVGSPGSGDECSVHFWRGRIGGAARWLLGIALYG